MSDYDPVDSLMATAADLVDGGWEVEQAAQWLQSALTAYVEPQAAQEITDNFFFRRSKAAGAADWWHEEGYDKCPHCGQGFVDYGGGWYKPVTNGEYGEATKFCPQCQTDLQNVDDRPVDRKWVEANRHHDYSQFTHYNHMTGRPCNCAWGKPRYRLKRQASQNVRMVRNQNQKAFRSEEGKEFLNQLEILADERPEIEGMVPWIASRYKKGDIGMDDSGLTYEGRPLRYALNRWANWFNAGNHPLRRGVNIMELSPEQVNSLAIDHDRQVREKEERDNWLRRNRESSEPQHVFGPEAGPYKGWQVHQIQNGEQAEAESEALGHCIGSDEQPYKHNIEQGNINAYSLRDPQGYPHVSWHINPSGEDIGHMQGKSGPVKPEYRDLISQFNNTYNLPDEEGREEQLEGEEPEEDAAWTADPPESVADYLDQYGEDNSLYEMAMNDYNANIGEYTEIYAGEPNWSYIAEDAINGRDMTPTTLEQLYQTAEMSRQLPELKQYIRDVEPDDEDGWNNKRELYYYFGEDLSTPDWTAENAGDVQEYIDQHHPEHNNLAEQAEESGSPYSKDAVWPGENPNWEDIAHNFYGYTPGEKGSYSTMPGWTAPEDAATPQQVQQMYEAAEDKGHLPTLNEHLQNYPIDPNWPHQQQNLDQWNRLMAPHYDPYTGEFTPHQNTWNMYQNPLYVEMVGQDIPWQEYIPGMEQSLSKKKEPKKDEPEYWNKEEVDGEYCHLTIYKEPKKSAAPRYHYHNSDPRNREGIQTNGLEARGFDEMPETPQGVYMTPNPWQYAEDVRNKTPQDTWRVDTTGLDVQTDPWEAHIRSKARDYDPYPNGYFSPAGGSYYSPHNIDPSRVSLWEPADNPVAEIDDMEGYGPHISKVAVMTLPQQQRAWQQLNEKYPSTSEVTHTFPDNWTVQHHPNAQDVWRVGNMMRNCWQPSEWDELDQDPKSIYYSDPLRPITSPASQPMALHDPTGIPRVAFYVNNPALFYGLGGDETPVISQALGARNKVPSEEEYERLRQFANTNGYDYPQWFPQNKTLSRAPMYDPLVCPSCGGHLTEPRQLNNTHQWVNSCPNCHGTFNVPPQSPLLQEYQKGWEEYPDLLKQVNQPAQWAEILSKTAANQLTGFHGTDNNTAAAIQQQGFSHKLFPYGAYGYTHEAMQQGYKHGVAQIPIEATLTNPLTGTRREIGQQVDQLKAKFNIDDDAKALREGGYDGWISNRGRFFVVDPPQQMSVVTQKMGSIKWASMTLQYLPTNMAWVVMFGDQIIPLDQVPGMGTMRFFESREQATEALRRVGLGVDDQGNISGLAQETAEHPDPWMDSEPGAVTFPEHWSANVDEEVRDKPENAFPSSSLGEYLKSIDKNIKHKPAPKKSYREIFAETVLKNYIETQENARSLP